MFDTSLKKLHVYGIVIIAFVHSLCSIQSLVGFVEDQCKLYHTLYTYHSLPSSTGVGGADSK